MVDTSDMSLEVVQSGLNAASRYLDHYKHCIERVAGLYGGQVDLLEIKYGELLQKGMPWAEVKEKYLEARREEAGLN